MNYIVYNEQSQMLARFETEAEGRAWLADRQRAWESSGQRCPPLRLCYNGTTSVLIATAPSAPPPAPSVPPAAGRRERARLEREYLAEQGKIDFNG